MTNTPSIIARAQKRREQRLQSGTLHSFTVVAHPPAGFPAGRRVIGLIEHANGAKSLGLILADAHTLRIGQTMLPRMAHMQTNAQGLRVYDAAYEPATVTEVGDQTFPGYILALTGPSGVGKSTIGRMLAGVMHERMATVPLVTTRLQKNGDDGEYRYISPREFLAMRKSGQIVAATMIPSRTEKRWYGYLRSDIEALWKEEKIPVVVTEMHLLQDLAARFGRRSILSFGLLPPGKSKRTMLSNLLHRLRSRGRDSEESIQERMKNAEKDLAFFEERTDLFDHLVVNENLDVVIDRLKGHVLQLQEA